MIEHVFVANPWPRDECDAKVSDDGRNTRQCGRPAREHAKPKTAEERVKELEEEIARLRTAKEQGVTLRWQTVEAAVAEADRLRLENTPLRVRVAALEKQLSEVGEVLHDAALSLESADWKLGVTRERTPWDNDLRALVARIRALDAAVTGTPSHNPAIRQLDAAPDPRDGCGKKHLGCHCALCRAALERPDPPGSENPQGFCPPPDWRAVATALVKLVYTHVHGPKIVDEVDAILQAHATKPAGGPDLAGAAGCKPEGLTVHRPDPEGLPPRSTEIVTCEKCGNPKVEGSTAPCPSERAARRP